MLFRSGQSFILAVCTSARGCFSLLFILIRPWECPLEIGNVTVKVGDPVEESVLSESSESFGCWCGEGRVSVGIEP